jgi:hypothetical protein
LAQSFQQLLAIVVFGRQQWQQQCRSDQMIPLLLLADVYRRDTDAANVAHRLVEGVQLTGDRPALAPYLIHYGSPFQLDQRERGFWRRHVPVRKTSCQMTAQHIQRD